MPFWGGYGGSPLGLGACFPLVGLVFMAVMAFFCFRMVGMAGPGCRGHRRDDTIQQPDDLRQEIEELREEVRRLREGVEGVTAWMQRE
jgi:hypothetical protein